MSFVYHSILLVHCRVKSGLSIGNSNVTEALALQALTTSIIVAKCGLTPTVYRINCTRVDMTQSPYSGQTRDIRCLATYKIAQTHVTEVYDSSETLAVITTINRYCLFKGERRVYRPRTKFYIGEDRF